MTEEKAKAAEIAAWTEETAKMGEVDQEGDY